MAKTITKTQASAAAKVIKAYAIQQAKKGAKKGQKITVAKTKKAAAKGFASLKKLFK